MNRALFPCIGFICVNPALVYFLLCLEHACSLTTNCFLIMHQQQTPVSWLHMQSPTKKLTFKSFPTSLVNNGEWDNWSCVRGSLWAAEGHRPPAWLIGKMALMLPSCHFSFLTKTPSATQPFAATESEYQWFSTISQLSVHLGVPSTPVWALTPQILSVKAL